jgi:predicted  nucleic acid-binding Zn-ribbon protein
MASSGGGMEDMSRDDLLEIIDELNKDLEERESHIQDLEKENIRLSRGKKGKRKGDDDGSDAEDAMARAAADVELERLRDKYDMEKIENSKLNDKINELTSFLKAVEAEKLELEADVRRLRQKADDLETAMATMQESTAQSLRRSQDITKAQKDVQKQQLQALQENEKLQQEVNTLSYCACAQ